MTDPLEAITFPYQVPQIIGVDFATVRDLATITFSIIALDIPIALIVIFTGVHLYMKQRKEA